MALIYKKGDILNAEENIICHQVNVNGVMGGGLAKQIASRYPQFEKEYREFCKCYSNDYDTLKGNFVSRIIEGRKQIANCFTQKPNFDTDYDALEKCFSQLLHYAKGCNFSLAIPYKYGCGIANGDWDKVSEILENLSNEIGIDIVVYQLDKER